MDKRLKLSDILHKNLNIQNVYYQSPESKNMSYPCVRYNKIPGDNMYADNNKYIKMQKYRITYIDKNPVSPVPDQIEDLNFCKLVTGPYQADGLNHWVFEIYI